LFGALALTIVVGYFLVTQRYWIPAHGGVDQNGYLVGAKNLLHTGSMITTPADPFAFVGRMWVTGHEPGTYYPKYPIGLPAIYAVALVIGGPSLVYLVNPLAMALALLATYLLASRFVGTFYGLLALLVVATSPVTTGLTNNPNSHASAICVVAWGMYLLVTWWEQPKDGKLPWARVVGSGLLLGMSVTIRYTEGLLLLPMGIVVLFVVWDVYGAPTLRRRRRAQLSEHADDAVGPLTLSFKPLVQSLVLFASWAVPVGALLIVNKAYFDSWTGYDPTHESTGFSWANLMQNWDTMLRQFYMTGLMFVFPLAVIGLIVWFRYDWRRALVISAWALPCVFIYTVYYWAPDTLAIGYSRFFLTAFPAIAIAGAIAMRALDHVHVSYRALARIGAVTCVVGLITGAVLASRIEGGWGAKVGLLVGGAAGAILGVVLFVRPAAIIIAAGCSLSLLTSVVNLENDQRGQLAVWNAAERITKRVPSQAVVFSKDNIIHHAQFVGDWQFYSIDLFNEGSVRNLAAQSDDLDKAQPFQAERAKALYDLLKDDKNPQLARRQNELMDNALAAGHRVFLVIPKREYDQHKNRFLPPKTYDAKVLDAWDDPPQVVNARATRPIGLNRPNRPVDRQSAWQIVEVTKALTTTAPATTKTAVTAKSEAVITTRPIAPVTKPVAPVTKPVAATTKPVVVATKPVVGTTRPVTPPPTTKPVVTQPATTRASGV